MHGPLEASAPPITDRAKYEVDLDVLQGEVNAERAEPLQGVELKAYKTWAYKEMASSEYYPIMCRAYLIACACNDNDSLQASWLLATGPKIYLCFVKNQRSKRRVLAKQKT